MRGLLIVLILCMICIVSAGIGKRCPSGGCHVGKRDKIDLGMKHVGIGKRCPAGGCVVGTRGNKHPCDDAEDYQRLIICLTKLG